MMPTASDRLEPYFTPYFDAVAEADPAAAAVVVDAAVGRGERPQRLIRGVVVPAQREVGARWFRGAWTVADEHAATAVSEQMLGIIAPPRAANPDADVVVVACAEGEWHTLPARLASELARAAGFGVVVLGGSVPADHLRKRLRSSLPRALALSCTMPTNLIGASRSIRAAQAEGIPVIVGGAAWGDGQHRAQQLGADGHLDDAGDLARALDEAERSPSLPPPPIPAEALLLDTPPQELILMALTRQTAANPWMRGMTEFQRARSVEDLTWLARHAAAAVACDDPTIVGTLLRWLLGLLTPRGVPSDAVLESCHFLADAVELDAPRGARILRQQAALATEQLSTLHARTTEGI